MSFQEELQKYMKGDESVGRTPLTRKEAARACMVSESTIYRWVSGRSEPHHLAQPEALMAIYCAQGTKFRGLCPHPDEDQGFYYGSAGPDLECRRCGWVREDDQLVARLKMGSGWGKPPRERRPSPNPPRWDPL